MKEIILPAITEKINTDPSYAPLRQVYYSLILAEWFKRKVSRLTGEPVNQLTGTPAHQQTGSPAHRLTGKPEPANPYAPYINSGTTAGLESNLPWSKQAIWQEYLKSYQQGEYKLQDTLFGLKRMYWSGGIIINLSASSIVCTANAGVAGDMTLKVISSGSCLTNSEVTTIAADNENFIPVLNSGNGFQPTITTVAPNNNLIATAESARITGELFIKYGIEHQLSSLEILFNQGDVPDGVYYIVEGSLWIVERELELLAGEIIGEICSLKSHQPRIATVQAGKDGARLLFIPLGQFKKIIEEDGNLKKIFKDMAHIKKHDWPQTKNGIPLINIHRKYASLLAIVLNSIEIRSKVFQLAGIQEGQDVKIKEAQFSGKGAIKYVIALHLKVDGSPRIISIKFHTNINTKKSLSHIDQDARDEIEGFKLSLKDDVAPKVFEYLSVADLFEKDKLLDGEKYKAFLEASVAGFSVGEYRPFKLSQLPVNTLLGIKQEVYRNAVKTIVKFWFLGHKADDQGLIIHGPVISDLNQDNFGIGDVNALELDVKLIDLGSLEWISLNGFIHRIKDFITRDLLEDNRKISPLEIFKGITEGIMSYIGDKIISSNDLDRSGKINKLNELENLIGSFNDVNKPNINEEIKTVLETTVNLIAEQKEQLSSSFKKLAKDHGEFYTGLIETILEDISETEKEKKVNILLNKLPPHLKKLYQEGWKRFKQEANKNKKLLDQHRGQEIEYLLSKISEYRGKNQIEIKKVVEEDILEAKNKIIYIEPYPGIPILEVEGAYSDKIALIPKTLGGKFWSTNDTERCPSFFIIKKNILDKLSPSVIKHELCHIIQDFLDRAGFLRKIRESRPEYKEAFWHFRNELLAYILDETNIMKLDVSKRLIYSKNKEILEIASSARDFLGLCMKIAVQKGIYPEDFLYPIAQARNFAEIKEKGAKIVSFLDLTDKNIIEMFFKEYSEKGFIRELEKEIIEKAGLEPLPVTIDSFVLDQLNDDPSLYTLISLKQLLKKMSLFFQDVFNCGFDSERLFLEACKKRIPLSEETIQFLIIQKELFFILETKSPEEFVRDFFSNYCYWNITKEEVRSAYIAVLTNCFDVKEIFERDKEEIINQGEKDYRAKRKDSLEEIELEGNIRERNSLMRSLVVSSALAKKKSASPAIEALHVSRFMNDDEQGGIDLSQINLTLKDEKFVSNLNIADYKIFLAAKALKQGLNPLSLLRAYEVIGYLRDKIVKPETIQNKKLFKQVLLELHLNRFLDFKALSYLKLLERSGIFAGK